MKLLLNLVLVIAACIITHAQVKLNVGDSISIPVEAWQETTSTNAYVSKNEVYQITASGTWADNGYPASNANGFKPFKFILYTGTILKPLPNYNYMMLGAKIGKLKLPIGTSYTLQVTKGGLLELFPNDARGFFDNNKGTLVVTITRIK